MTEELVHVEERHVATHHLVLTLLAAQAKGHVLVVLYETSYLNNVVFN